MAIVNPDAETVKATLGESTLKWFELVTSSLINKWSKYKPVRTVAQHQWPEATDRNFGFNLINGAGLNKWDYLKPRGGASNGEPTRAGDFEGYEHSKALAFPSIQCRNTDNSFSSDIYPGGSPFSQIWIIRAYRSASSVIIIPSDLGLDNYYVGLKIAFNDHTYYKTFQQVNALNFLGTSNILMNIEPRNWTTLEWDYYDLPQGTGLCSWQLFISANATTGWQESLSGAVVYFPEDSDGTNTFISSGSFTVHDWIKVTESSLAIGVSGGYAETTPYCSTANYPNFSIIKDADWITAEVYQNGFLVNNPALYASSMQVRATVPFWANQPPVTPTIGTTTPAQDWTLDPAYTSGSISGSGQREGHITITSEGVDVLVTVAQSSSGSDQLTFAFRSVDLGPGDTPIDVVIKRGYTTVFSDTTGIFRGRDGFTKTYVVTINETAQVGYSYDVYLTRH